MESPDHPSSTRQFKRSYVACVSCRARKSRCIVKDNPPCAKCAREHRECRFDRRPRAPKHRDAPKWTRGNVDAAPATQPVQVANHSPSEDLGFNSSPNNANHPLYNRVQSTIVTGTNDALDFLSSAAGQHSIAGSAPSQDHQSASNVQNDGPKVVSDMWDKCRFVRQGWFTAQEAVTYIDLFCEKLAPLSPVVLDQFRSHASHEHLVYREAMLCCTLLMISSRFFTLPGAGGTSRSHYVHQRLWSHCEVLIRRIVLGQEKTSTSQTRTIGTIESLILISDWHPRALHLPPETDGWDGLLVTPGYDRVNRKHINNEVPLIRWREDVFEPAKRANRMSWMLLGIANNQTGDIGHPVHAEVLRGRRAQKLLYNYLTQTATRLGYPSVFPESISVIASRLPMPDASESIDQSWISYMDLSLELTQLSRTASSMLFHSAAHLQTQVLGDHYVDLLEHFSLSLSKWQEKFNSMSQDIASPLKDTLLVEFHHTKACTGAISIQAVVARASSAGFTAATTNSDEALSAFITPKDAKFLQEVISDTKKVLHIATLSGFRDHLPFAPARVKISVISSSVFLLKALSVGSIHTDVNDALYTLDQCTSTLKQCPADDMDFALRYADLIEKHTAQFRAHLTQPRGLSSGHRSGRASIARNVVQGQTSINGPNSFLSSLDSQQLGDDGAMMNFDMGDTWVPLPFDSSIAPFSEGGDQVALGLDVDALNFLWSLPELVQGETGFA
ncbi:ARO80-positive transcription regulator of ARO9 and ARO10 [Fusarium subglutinans]|uniref:ARO80-positive transcription regulator of ARO9 and ARO10 n=1 Tax=Gibberella subglutinans TaxID=42677 RepID=A0A8H5UXK8_GIBSU|nr:ARO80-positive transcription regulator of ARO9 and ARO10 [Fusarium subglutinans]KAF5603122.1 ARO80-positive transcription regulator of ARO9 and ARO10 [Fusarium subglutinans]